MKSDLTPRQAEVMRYIQDKRHWRPPSYRMIARHYGVTGVNDIIQALIRKGYLIPNGQEGLLIRKYWSERG